LKTKLFFFFALILGIIITSTVLAERKSDLNNEEVLGLRMEKLDPTSAPTVTLTPIPAFTLTPILTPTLPPQINPDFLELREALQAEIEKAWFDIAVSITDLQTGQTINVKGNDPRLPGCTMNFFVLLSVILDLEKGLYSEEEVSQLISETIWGSNAWTAHQLLIKTGQGNVYQGIEKVNSILFSLGLQSEPNPALFDHPPAYPEESLFGKINNSITSNQANKTLTKLYKGEVLTPRWRDYFLEKLTGVKPGLNYLIPSAISDGKVSHKNGFFWDSAGWVDNDIGIVIFERSGKEFAYAISLYMEEIPSKYADIPIGQEISRLVWEYFSNKYQ